MTVLDIKVMRDLWSLRAQVLSIALLIASGIAVLAMSVSNYLALVDAMVPGIGDGLRLKEIINSNPG